MNDANTGMVLATPPVVPDFAAVDAIVEDPDTKEQRAGDQSMRNHLHHAAGHAQFGAHARFDRPDDEKTERDEAHVRYRRISDELLHVRLHQGNQADIDNRDQRQGDH